MRHWPHTINEVVVCWSFVARWNILLSFVVHCQLWCVHVHKPLLVASPSKLYINGLLFHAGWWQGWKRQRQSKGKSSFTLPKGWTTGNLCSHCMVSWRMTCITHFASLPLFPVSSQWGVSIDTWRLAQPATAVSARQQLCTVLPSSSISLLK